MVFHRPDRRAPARAGRAPAQRPGTRQAIACFHRQVSCRGVAARLQNSAASMSISGATPARARADQRRGLGQQLGEVEARRRQLGRVERVARRLLRERHLGHARPEVGEHQVAADAQVVDRGGADLVGVLNAFMPISVVSLVTLSPRSASGLTNSCIASFDALLLDERLRSACRTSSAWRRCRASTLRPSRSSDWMVLVPS